MSSASASDGSTTGESSIGGTNTGEELEDGEELAAVSRTLGHADLSTTADVYAHLTRATLERSAARMDRILSRKASTG